MTVTEQLVQNVIDREFGDFDPDTLQYAKLRIIDTIGALLGGIRSSGADMMFDLIRGWGGQPESSILGTQEKVPSANAALVMGIMARSNDLEPAGGPDINDRKSPGHYSATSVPTAIAVTERLGLGGRDFITALILGDDLASRIGTAGAGPWDLGWDPAGTCSRFGATAIAGKLMGLDKGQMLNALGIALTQIGGTMLPVYEYTHSFKISQGLAGWNGIVSAELAKKGFTGPEDPLMGKFGYYQQFCREVITEVLTANLGEIFYGDEEFKLYPSCRGNASPVETALKLISENTIDPDSIIEIRIDLNSSMKDSFLVQPFKHEPCAQAVAILNLSYNVANVILRKSVKLQHYTDEATADPDIKAITDKIKINPTASGERLFCRIAIQMDDGRELSAVTDVPRGDFRAYPLTQDEIQLKFLSSVEYSRAISQQQAEKAMLLLERLETLDSLDELIELLVPH